MQSTLMMAACGCQHIRCGARVAAMPLTYASNAACAHERYPHLRFYCRVPAMLHPCRCISRLTAVGLLKI